MRKDGYDPGPDCHFPRSKHRFNKENVSTEFCGCGSVPVLVVHKHT